MKRAQRQHQHDIAIGESAFIPLVVGDVADGVAHNADAHVHQILHVTGANSKHTRDATSNTAAENFKRSMKISSTVMVPSDKCCDQRTKHQYTVYCD